MVTGATGRKRVHGAGEARKCAQRWLLTPPDLDIRQPSVHIHTRRIVGLLATRPPCRCRTVGGQCSVLARAELQADVSLIAASGPSARRLRQSLSLRSKVGMVTNLPAMASALPYATDESARADGALQVDREFALSAGPAAAGGSLAIRSRGRTPLWRRAQKPRAEAEVRREERHELLGADRVPGVAHPDRHHSSRARRG